MTHPWPVPSSQFQTEGLDLRFWLKAVHVRSPMGTLITFKVMDLFTSNLTATRSRTFTSSMTRRFNRAVYSFGCMRTDCLAPVQA